MSSSQTSAVKHFFLLLICSLFFIPLGATFAFFGAQGIIKGKASVDWPSVSGKVVESSVKSHHHNSRTGRRRSGSSTTRHAEIRYEFAIGGITYSGKRVSYGDYGSSNPSHAQSIVNRYPKDKSVKVFYMPENPMECLLEPGMKGHSWILPVIGLVFFSAGLLMAAFLPKSIRK